VRIAVDAGVLCANWGGIPKYVDRIVSGLVEEGEEVDLLANVWRLPRTVPGARDVGLRVKGTALWREVALPAWLARSRPDVFWAPEGRLPRLVPVPTVVTLHDLGSVLFRTIKPADHTALFSGAMCRSARRADRVIAISHTTANDAERLWDIDPAGIRVVPLGIDECFTPGDIAAARQIARQRWGLTFPFVLAVGSLEPRKGLDVLAAAAAEAARTHRPWRVVLVGRLGYRGHEIAERARQAGCLLLGGVDDDELVSLYRAAGAVAVPSLYEGFGLTPLEALACGTPAVISQGAGALEEMSGEHAVVVAERTSAAWVNGIDRALSDHEQLRALKFARPREGHSWGTG
jgi:glycosyltransferase involved in cell wall biosynthesis